MSGAGTRARVNGPRIIHLRVEYTQLAAVELYTSLLRQLNKDSQVRISLSLEKNDAPDIYLWADLRLVPHNTITSRHDEKQSSDGAILSLVIDEFIGSDDFHPSDTRIVTRESGPNLSASWYASYQAI